MTDKEKKKRGRPPMDGSMRMSQRVVTLDDKTSFKLIKLGDGNLSKGIRIAAEIAYEKKVLENDLDD